MPYGQVPHAEKHGVRIGLDISAVVFVIHLTKIKVKKIHPWVLWLEAYIPTMGWLAYQYYMTGAYKNKNKNKNKTSSFGKIFTPASLDLRCVFFLYSYLYQCLL